MKIKKIQIDNFKSIDKITMDVKKIDESFTTILVGLNESGKSNILRAFSLFNKPQNHFDFTKYCNQKREDADYIDIYFELEFDSHSAYRKIIQKKINYESELEFVLTEITKNVYLAKHTTEFEERYEYKILLPEKKYYYGEYNGEIIIKTKNDAHNSLNELTSDSFNLLFSDTIEEIIKKFEPRVSFWTPSPDYLLSDINLHEFKDNLQLSKPLRNIFYLAGINTREMIHEKIEATNNPQQRSRLTSKLQESLNKYVSAKWKHEIDFVIDITETGFFSLSIKDKGEDNSHDRFALSERSDGAKHYLSLILSLSLETNNRQRRDHLILIDEPEQHLHPSGIRDLLHELLNIGRSNFLFIATHSPFLIDRKNKSRHYIVKKNKHAITEIQQIREHQNIFDDEVLREAFGIDVYRDLINPHSLIVEGASDKVILQKVFHTLGYRNIGITNGHGSNIDKVAAKLNYENLSILVILDDDQDGRMLKRNIINIAGAYSSSNVYTLRDVVHSMPDQGTIEDLLNLQYVISQFNAQYKNIFNEEPILEIVDNAPIIKQLTAYLNKTKRTKEWDMDMFKTNLSENFRPSKSDFQNSNPLLYTLGTELINLLGINKDE